MVLRVIAVAILSIFLMGATTVEHPACATNPEDYASFLTAIMSEDEFVVSFYTQMGCGLMKPDMPATVIERGPYWIKIKVEPEGFDPVILYTSSEAIEEEEE